MRRKTGKLLPKQLGCYDDGGRVRKPPPLNVARGLKEALVDPIAKDMREAYWMQRAARARYPASDAVTNFVPYVGAAINADDIQRSARDEGAVHPGDVAGLALNAAMIKSGLKGATATAREAEALKSGMGGRSLALTVGAPGVAYVDNYRLAQKRANEKYGDRPLRDISVELQQESQRKRTKGK